MRKRTNPPKSQGHQANEIIAVCCYVLAVMSTCHTDDLTHLLLTDVCECGCAHEHPRNSPQWCLKTHCLPVKPNPISAFQNGRVGVGKKPLNPFTAV